MNRKTWKYYWLRNPRTTQERRFSTNVLDWEDDFGKVHIRGRRKRPNLPTSYDDIPFRKQKSWKKTRKKQCRGRSQATRHEIEMHFDGSWWYCTNYRRYQRIKQYFEDHQIPHRIEDIRTTERFWSEYHQTNIRRTITRGYRVIWWSSKDIGIDMI